MTQAEQKEQQLSQTSSELGDIAKMPEDKKKELFAKNPALEKKYKEIEEKTVKDDYEKLKQDYEKAMNLRNLDQLAYKSKVDEYDQIAAQEQEVMTSFNNLGSQLNAAKSQLMNLKANSGKRQETKPNTKSEQTHMGSEKSGDDFGLNSSKKDNSAEIQQAENNLQSLQSQFDTMQERLATIRQQKQVAEAAMKDAELLMNDSQQKVMEAQKKLEENMEKYKKVFGKDVDFKIDEKEAETTKKLEEMFSDELEPNPYNHRRAKAYADMVYRGRGASADGAGGYRGTGRSNGFENGISVGDFSLDNMDGLPAEIKEKVKGFDYNSYKEGIADIESGGRYGARNDAVGRRNGVSPDKWAFGRYQFIVGTLRGFGVDLGGNGGVDETKVQSYLSNKQEQERVMKEYTQNNAKTVISKFGNQIKSDQDLAVMLSICHHSGPGGLSKYMNTGSLGKDWMGASTGTYKDKLAKNYEKGKQA